MTNTEDERTPDPLTDPVTFADEIAGRLYTFTMLSPSDETVAFYKARHAFLKANPHFKRDGITGLFNLMDEAITAWEGAAMSKGVRVGAAIEYLRQAVFDAQTLCLPCHGSGVARDDAEGECRTCRGRGSVPTRAQ